MNNNYISLKVTNLTKIFKGKIIFKNISFQIKKGEILGLLGANGSGKTTLIQVLLGLIEQEKGEIIFFGNNNFNWQQIYKRINVIASFSQLQDQLTIMENLIIYAKLYQVTDYLSKISKLINFFDLKILIKEKRRLINLSSGEYMKVLFCKAFLNDPEIIFMDEPTANLDPLMSAKIIKYILDQKNKKKVSILYTSHNLEEAKKVCDRIAFLKNKSISNIIDKKNFKNLLNYY
jgi:ABC-2 type transport system ATP-binding protein